MSWNRNNPSERPPSPWTIRVDRLLYEYDGPQIFVSKLGFANTFFLKVDESDDSNLFLASQIEAEVVEKIAEGVLSVRSAFDVAFAWIVEVRENWSVEQYWSVPIDELPEDFLPEANVALYPGLKSVPDTLQEADAYFSISFKGASLKHSSIPFGVFRGLVDGAYEATRKILSPGMLSNTRSSTFDFAIGEPRFSSLVVALQRPIFNETYIQKKTRTSITAEELGGEMAKKRTDFFDEVGLLIQEAEQGDIPADQASEKFFVLDQIADLLPSELNTLTRVVFSASTFEGMRTIAIDEKVGERLQAAHRAAETSTVVETGAITLINWKSSTFVIASDRGKEVTCQLTEDQYEEMEQSGSFTANARVKVRGHLTRRVNRDLLAATAVPQFVG